MSNNLAAIRAIAEALGEMKDDVVFVGGAAVELYIDDSAVPKPQPSEDVDCAVEILTYKEWIQFEQLLRNKGFVDFDTSGEDLDPPSCRKYIMDMKVDFMPIEEDVLGYTNKWFKKGLQEPRRIKIDNIEINIFHLEFFLAAKFQAYLDRGQSFDIRLSKDLEDITELFDGVIEIEKLILKSESGVREFLVTTISLFLSNISEIQEAMIGFLDYDSTTMKVKRAARIQKIFERITLN